MYYIDLNDYFIFSKKEALIKMWMNILKSIKIIIIC